MVKSYEMFYTGGGIWCVSGELEGGRFFNGSCDEGLNLFSTKEAMEASWESFCEEDPGFLGYPEEATCKQILAEIFCSEISKGSYAAEEAKQFLLSMADAYFDYKGFLVAIEQFDGETVFRASWDDDVTDFDTLEECLAFCQENGWEGKK